MISVCAKTLEVINGACGSANKGYVYDASGYGTDSFCSKGNASPSSPAFPSVGNSVSWICNGINGGTNASCSANHESVIYTETIDGNYIVGTFTLAGSTSASTSWIAPAGVTSVEYLVVAGGGSSGNTYNTFLGAGGGGGGEVKTGLLNVTPGNSYFTTVGSGGFNSIFSNITALAGVSGSGRNGGMSGNGYSGGSGSGDSGGGGGAGGGGNVSIGGNGAAVGGNYQGGNGGNGVLSLISGFNVYYGGGGGGGSYGGSPGTGGIGGGGNGTTGNGSSGGANTGGGAGGGRASYSFLGGSGIVIIRYSIP
ncbi:MAG: hypothetical protein PHW52_03540 [Candidatus Pacebacteria bacterium]|nr:hypothetical protein [Candidatus Paceibacterota bacterium]